MMEIKEPLWEHQTLYHGPGCLEEEKRSTHLEVAKKVVGERNQAGVYAYFKDSKCLYIGKAQCLLSRVHAHLLESECIWGAPKWQDFFSQNPGKIDLFLLRLGGSDFEDNHLRIIVESLLTVEHKPIWLNHKFKKSS